MRPTQLLPLVVIIIIIIHLFFVFPYSSRIFLGSRISDFQEFTNITLKSQLQLQCSWDFILWQ